MVPDPCSTRLLVRSRTMIKNRYHLSCALVTPLSDYVRTVACYILGYSNPSSMQTHPSIQTLTCILVPIGQRKISTLPYEKICQGPTYAQHILPSISVRHGLFLCIDTLYSVICRSKCLPLLRPISHIIWGLDFFRYILPLAYPLVDPGIDGL